MEWILTIRTPLLTPFFQYITWLGYSDFLFLFIPFCYWFLDRTKYGIFPLFIFVSALINSFLKEFFQDPRPDDILNIDPWLHGMDPSYGFPSGHAQLAVVIWGFLLLRTQKSFLKSIFLFLIISISFSRLYLGVHDLTDIIGGLIIGIFSIFVLEQLLSPKFKSFRTIGRTKHFLIYISVLIVFTIFWPAQDDKTAILALGGLIIGFWMGKEIDSSFMKYQPPQNKLLSVLSSIIALIGFILINENIDQLFSLVSLHKGIEISISSLILGIYISFIAPSILYLMRLQSTH